MNSIGVIYNWYNKLPRFDSVFTRSEVDPLKTVKILKEIGLVSDKIGDKQDIINILGSAEKQFGQEMLDTHNLGGFFFNLVWLNEQMPKIRLKVRKAYLSDADINKIIDEVDYVCGSNNLAAKVFGSYFTKSNSLTDKNLSTLESDMDEIYFTILKKASGLTNSNLKSYLGLLRKRSEDENTFRIKLRVAKEEENKQDHDKYFKNSFEEECRYANQAIFEADTDLISLQCMVCYKYFFYDLRVNFSLKDSDKSDILVNYNIN